MFPKNVPEELKKCAPFRMKQNSGTCWFNSVLNIIIFTDVMKENLYKYINNLSPEDQEIVDQLEGYDDIDIKYTKEEDGTFSAPELKLKHLISGLFTFFKRGDKPQHHQQFIEDLASRVKSIGEFGRNTYWWFFYETKNPDFIIDKYYLEREDNFLTESKTDPKYFGTGYDPSVGMEVMIQYFNLNDKNDNVMLKDKILTDNKKELKLEVTNKELREKEDKLFYDNRHKLHSKYRLDSICFGRFFIHVSSGFRCSYDKNKFVTYDSNNIIKWERWFQTQIKNVKFCIYVKI
jgi:hypothetical protein